MKILPVTLKSAHRKILSIIFKVCTRRKICSLVNLKAKSEEILEQLLLTSPCLQHSANGSLVSKYCSANYFTDGRRFWCNSKLYHNVVWFGMAVYHKINNIKDGQSGLSL